MVRNVVYRCKSEAATGRVLHVSVLKKFQNSQEQFPKLTSKLEYLFNKVAGFRLQKFPRIP